MVACAHLKPLGKMPRCVLGRPPGSGSRHVTADQSAGGPAQVQGALWGHIVPLA